MQFSRSLEEKESHMENFDENLALVSISKTFMAQHFNSSISIQTFLSFYFHSFQNISNQNFWTKSILRFTVCVTWCEIFSTPWYQCFEAIYFNNWFSVKRTSFSTSNRSLIIYNYLQWHQHDHPVMSCCPHKKKIKTRRLSTFLKGNNCTVTYNFLSRKEESNTKQADFSEACCKTRTCLVSFIT